MADFLYNLAQPHLADVNVMTARAWQPMPHQDRDGVAVAVFVCGGREEMLELVEALPLDLQADPFGEFAESFVGMVGAADLLEFPAFHHGLDATPRIAFTCSENEIVARALQHNFAQSVDGLGPQRHDVRLAGLPASIIDLGSGQVHNVARKLGQLFSAVSAVQGQEDHRLHLLPTWAPATVACGELGIDARDDLFHLVGGVQLPLHRCPIANDKARGHSPAEMNVTDPSAVDGVGGATSQVLNGTPREVGADALAAQFVLHPCLGLQSSLLGIAPTIDEPAAEDVVHGHNAADALGLAHGLLPTRQRGGLSVIDGERFLGRALPANPLGLAVDPLHVSAICDRQRETTGQNWRPIHASQLSEPLGIRVMRDTKTTITVQETPLQYKTPGVGKYAVDRKPNQQINSEKSGHFAPSSRFDTTAVIDAKKTVPVSCRQAPNAPGDGRFTVVCESCSREYTVSADTARRLNRDSKLCPSCRAVKAAKARHFVTPDSTKAERVRANGLVNKRVKLGHVTRPDRCQLCEKIGRVDGHHPDYGKPGEVQWLCRSCHMKVHHEERQRAAGVPISDTSRKLDEFPAGELSIGGAA